ncbi:hypothetical protein D9M70_397360 [compost metagenome]
MHGAEHQRGGGAVAQQFLEEDAGDVGGMGLVGELLFGGEGIGVQPVQQLLAIGGDHAGLREVDMGIDEAGRDQGIAVFAHLDPGGQAGQQGLGFAQGLDVAVFHHHQTVFEILIGLLDTHQGGVGDAVQDGGAVGGYVAGHVSLVR